MDVVHDAGKPGAPEGPAPDRRPAPDRVVPVTDAPAPADVRSTRTDRLLTLAAALAKALQPGDVVDAACAAADARMGAIVPPAPASTPQGDADADAEAAAGPRAARAEVALSLHVGDRPFGRLALSFAAPRILDRDEQAHLRLVAAFCAQALDRIRLDEEACEARWALDRSRAETRAATERVDLAMAAGAIVGTWDWDVRSDRVTLGGAFIELFGLDAAVAQAGVALARVVARVVPDDVDGLRRALDTALRRGGPFAHVFRIPAPGGLPRWVQATGRVELGADGRAVRLPGVLVDIERSRALEAERDRALRLLHAFVEAVPGVVYAKDRDGRMLVANRGVSELVGRPLDALLGRTDAEFLDHKDQAATVMATDRRIMDSGVAEVLEEAVSFPDGRHAIWLSTKAPFRDADGRVVGLIGSSVDITARKDAEAALRERTDELGAAQLRLEVALSAARMGVWDWSPVTGESRWNAQMFEILGLPPAPDRPVRGEAFLERVHPDDRPRIDAALARALAEGSDFDVEVRLVGADHRVRWVLGRGKVLADAQGRAERMVGVNLDITERKTAEQSLMEADRHRNEFLAMLGHELRNPLAPVANAVRLLERTEATLDQRRFAVEIIRRQTTHMARLVDDLLEVSRVTQGRIDLRREHVRVATVVQSAVETVRPLVRERGQSLAVETAPDVDVVADPARLIQVVANLLNNAAKYTQPGGRIAVRARAVDDAWVEIVVEDDGPGIDAALLPRVFDLFAQGATTLDRSRGGLGLGLTLVRRLVEMHGGTVRAASPGPGLGATFTVRLPRTERRGTRRGGAASPVAGTGMAPTSILVVDDNVDAVESLVLLLEVDGHRVDRAHDGQEALAAARRHRPRVVLLDIGLPGMDGWDVARALRAMPELGDPVLVALSGYGQEADRERSREAGFDEHLLKPVDLGVLYAAVGEALGRRGGR